MYTKRFKIAKWFIVANYLVIPLSFFFSIFFLYFAIPRWDYNFRSDIVLSILFALAGIGFAIGGIYSMRIVPRLRDTILVTDAKIIHEHFNGSMTQLYWKENFTLRERTLLGRLELISRDGQRKIMVENQLEHFQELKELIQKKWRENQEIKFDQQLP
jgi:hypothetical protein